jgi:MFS family permease
MMVTMTTVSFYLITAYTPTFGQEVLHLSPLESLAVTLCVGLSNFIWLPVMGAVSDRVGRRPVLITFTLAALLTAYPTMFWLVARPSFLRLLLVELWLSFVYASYNGGMVVMLTEIMPMEVRTSGFSLACSLATALFGGSTPAICTYLITSRTIKRCRECGCPRLPWSDWWRLYWLGRGQWCATPFQSWSLFSLHRRKSSEISERCRRKQQPRTLSGLLPSLERMLRA